jgi:hypothetical protein
MTKNQSFSFHYTIGEHIPSIISDGYLKRSFVGLTDGELPVLWFSRNQRFERTSRKGLFYRGHKLNWDVSLQHELMTNVRFGIPHDDNRLLDWKTTCKVSGTPNEDIRLMEKRGKMWSSFPSDWFGVLSDVSIDELTFQVWDGSKWIDKNVQDWCLNDFRGKSVEEKESIIIEHYKRLHPKGWTNNPIFNEDNHSQRKVIQIQILDNKMDNVVRLRFPDRDVVVPTDVFNRTIRKGYLTERDINTFCLSQVEVV